MKRKKKTLAERKETVKYWRDKADILFSELERKTVGHCQICSKLGLARKGDGAMIKGLHIHHIIERDWYRYRYRRNNTIVVCVGCHGSMANYRNRSCSAHGSLIAQDLFYAIAWDKFPEKKEFYELHKPEGKTEKDENGHVVVYKSAYYKEIFEALNANKT